MLHVSKELYIQILYDETRVVEKSTYGVLSITHKQFDAALHSKKIKQVKTINLINNIISLYEYYVCRELFLQNSSRLYLTASNTIVRRVDVKGESITINTYVKIDDNILSQYIDYLNFSSPNNVI